ncbi:RES family NAD+ phosphorylase [Luteimonas sp. Y-2-2-4F]|nr:RES family NAD+ phosphorylase [Luteimonas sp. Y-2-2-4F]MCD9033609.1 RES family NAD+ phosphorylase [Luteimonas sp. Y-2-2-4F]
MRLWRISAHPGLDGTGGHHVDGRWHTRPRPVLYAAEHPALAMVEIMAHMRLSLTGIPTTLKLIAIEVAEGASVSAAPALPEGWQANEPTSQAVGNAWLDARAALLLPLPSALLPESTNYLINAGHPQAATHLREAQVRPFWFDKRYLR